MEYFFTCSPIKRLIFTQKGTFDFEVFSHIHVLRSMFFFVKPPHFSNPNSQKRHHSFVTTHPPLDIIILSFIYYLIMFLWALDLWVFSAFMDEQNCWQCGQLYPAVLTCLDSTCSYSLVLYLVVQPQVRQSHPCSVLIMLLDIMCSISMSPATHVTINKGQNHQLQSSEGSNCFIVSVYLTQSY